MIVSHIESKLNQRRNAGVSVAEYINRALWAQRFKEPNPPTFEDYRPFLTPEEIHEFEIMMVEREKQEAEARARREIEQQAEWEAQVKKAKEERERFLALTPQQQVAELENGVIKGIDGLLANIDESIDHNAYQFIDDRLPWSVKNNCCDWQEDFRSHITGIIVDQIVNLSPEDAELDEDRLQDYILEYFDISIDDVIRDAIQDVLSTVKVVVTDFDREKFLKRQALFIAEVKGVFDSKNNEVIAALKRRAGGAAALKRRAGGASVLN